MITLNIPVTDQKILNGDTLSSGVYSYQRRSHDTESGTVYTDNNYVVGEIPKRLLFRNINCARDSHSFTIQNSGSLRLIIAEDTTYLSNRIGVKTAGLTAYIESPHKIVLLKDRQVEELQSMLSAGIKTNNEKIIFVTKTNETPEYKDRFASFRNINEEFPVKSNPNELAKSGFYLNKDLIKCSGCQYNISFTQFSKLDKTTLKRKFTDYFFGNSTASDFSILMQDHDARLTAQGGKALCKHKTFFTELYNREIKEKGHYNVVHQSFSDLMGDPSKYKHVHIKHELLVTTKDEDEIESFPSYLFRTNGISEAFERVKNNFISCSYRDYLITCEEKFKEIFVFFKNNEWDDKKGTHQNKLKMLELLKSFCRDNGELYSLLMPKFTEREGSSELKTVSDIEIEKTTDLLQILTKEILKPVKEILFSDDEIKSLIDSTVMTKFFFESVDNSL